MEGEKQGNIVHSIDILQKQEYNYAYEEGRLVEAITYDITLDENQFITSKTLVYTKTYFYDKEDKLVHTRLY